MKKLFKKLVNRETLMYLLFGVLTTVVNYIIYYPGIHLFPQIDVLIINAIAWVVAVLFAFVTNKLFVFESKSWQSPQVFKELGSFLTARILSFVLEMGFMALAVKVLNMNEDISKLVISVLVVILNYFASKFIIFRKKNESHE